MAEDLLRLREDRSGAAAGRVPAEALRLGLISEAVPVLRVDGRVLPNPLVVSDRWVENGRLVRGPKAAEPVSV